MTAMRDSDATALTPVTDGAVLWTPSPAWQEGTGLFAFMAWLAKERGLSFDDYGALWQWSIDDVEGFWRAVWDYFHVESDAPPTVTLADASMPGASWFPGVKLNFAQHVMRQERAGVAAVMAMNEDQVLREVPWEVFGAQVRVVATQLRARGVQPGDRVVGYMTNVPEAMIAMLAATSIGAIWASCSPDFGVRGVLDRFSQLKPKVLFCMDSYVYGGRRYDRRAELTQIVSGLESLECVVTLRPDATAQVDASPALHPKAQTWDELLDHPEVTAESFEFEPVPFGHPLWVLFSSGTTGLPKPIVHGHGGILLESLKSLHFHMDHRRGERAFFFTTTGWMMWNFLASTLLAGTCPVLYDGNPAYPDADVLWRMADASGASFFGASPSYVELMQKTGIVPRERYKLSNLRAVMVAGSPVSAECTAWFYENVKSDLWVAAGSGGTDVCSGLVGGVPLLPVRAGEIQGRSLGVAAFAFNDRGEPVIDEVGELVIVRPMPSMPVGFWGDTDGLSYREAYFTEFPGVWRHGDFFKVNARGGCFVLGRSDATLNRHGVRIGTAEIYRALARVAGVEDFLIVNLDLPGGSFFMPLFVKLSKGVELDDALRDRIRGQLRAEYTPRHVPDQIVAVSDIPYTLTGKRMEVPVRRLLLGMAPERAASRDAMRDPAVLDHFVRYARTNAEFMAAVGPQESAVGSAP